MYILDGDAKQSRCENDYETERAVFCSNAETGGGLVRRPEKQHWSSVRQTVWRCS